MRLLRYVMMMVAALLIVLTAVSWRHSLFVVEYATADATSIHYEGHRASIFEVLDAVPTPTA